MNKSEQVARLMEFHKMFHASTTLAEARERAKYEGWTLKLEWDGLVGLYHIVDPNRPKECLGSVSLIDGYGEPEAGGGQ